MAEISLEAVVSEIDKIKTALSPVLNFLQEIKDMKRGLHIAAESSISTLQIISLSIKGEVMKDVISLLSTTEEKINGIAEESKDRDRVLGDKLDLNRKQGENLGFEIKNVEELIVRQNYALDIFRKDIDFAKKELNDKVGYTEFIKLQKSLKKYSTVEEVNKIKEKIEELAEKTQIDSLKKDIKKINSKLDECLPRKEAEKRFEGIENELLNKFSLIFTRKDTFESELSHIEKRFSRNEEDSKGAGKKNDMYFEGFKRKVSELFDIINSKPWDLEIKLLVPQIDNSVTKAEISKIKEDILDRISKIVKQQAEQIKKSQAHELIVERIDEILLDKASKDDILFVTKQIEKCVLLSTHKEQADFTGSRFSLVSTQINDLVSTSNAIKSILSSLSQKIETLKRENSDVSNISSTLQSINELMDRKADKSDIFLIYDVMGKKEEITKLSETEDLSRKQFLLFVGVTQTLCRTLLNNGENIAHLKKLRLDIYKTLEGLQKWIKEGNGEPSSMLAIGRSNVNLKTEMFEECPYGNFRTARTSRRIRLGSQRNSPRYIRDDLPAIGLNV